MGIEEDFRGVVERSLAALVASGALPREAVGAPFTVERPKRADHGDLAINAPLSLAKLAKQPPRAIAERLAERLRKEPSVTSVESSPRPIAS